MTEQEWNEARKVFEGMTAEDFGNKCGWLLQSRMDLSSERNAQVEVTGSETSEEYHAFYNALEDLTLTAFGKLGIEAHYNNSWSFQTKYNAPSWAKVICNFLVCAIEYAEDSIKEKGNKAFNKVYREYCNADERMRDKVSREAAQLAEHEAIQTEVKAITEDGTELARRLKVNMEYVPAEGKYM